ncbi:hypothetical protein E2C01_057232 [Portunus trituberculatus]|uniref:Uncharacterized protein n=1 Tax=Portunus trituberculatus TaxID=210409 RepID=A0A5B7H1T4_PORTR|nr:hypothetical protein [Portunus trituberculatus]
MWRPMRRWTGKKLASGGSRVHFSHHVCTVTDTCQDGRHRVPIPEFPMLTNAANTAGGWRPHEAGRQAPGTAAWRGGGCRKHTGQEGEAAGSTPWRGGAAGHEAQVIGLVK